jgi:hypothetical protein
VGGCKRAHVKLGALQMVAAVLFTFWIVLY